MIASLSIICLIRISGRLAQDADPTCGRSRLTYNAFAARLGHGLGLGSRRILPAAWLSFQLAVQRAQLGARKMGPHQYGVAVVKIRVPERPSWISDMDWGWGWAAVRAEWRAG